MSSRIPIQELWDEMSRTFRSYPKGVVPVPELIRGTAFFPGGFGLVVDDGIQLPSTATAAAAAAAANAEIMVVGQDFSTIATYEITLQRGSEFATNRTWLNMRRVFPKLGLSLDRCFFTNFYMGLREQGPETGPFPGGRDKDFVRQCGRFFERQMEVLRPKVIVALGLAPLRAIGREVFQLEVPRTLSRCVEVYSRVPAAHGDVAFVTLTHPSFYDANVGRRRFLDYQGSDAEKAMVLRALHERDCG